MGYRSGVASWSLSGYGAVKIDDYGLWSTPLADLSCLGTAIYEHIHDEGHTGDGNDRLEPEVLLTNQLQPVPPCAMPVQHTTPAYMQHTMHLYRAP